MKSHPQHLAEFLGLDRDHVELVESDPESSRRRYQASDGHLYDVEPVERRNEAGELERALAVAIVLPLDEAAVGLDPSGTCPTCGRTRARAFRRYTVTDKTHAAAVIEEHGV